MKTIDTILGTAVNFGILASTSVSNAGLTVLLGGDLGVYPGTSVTGFPPGVLTFPATQHINDAIAHQAQIDAAAAYATIAAFTPTAPCPSVLDGLTFLPGVYNNVGAVSLGANQIVHLDAQGNSNAQFIFQIGSTFTVGSFASVVLLNGAQIGNIVWLVGTTMLLSSTVFIGNILATGHIALGGGTYGGRAISIGGAVDIAAATALSVPIHLAGILQVTPIFLPLLGDGTSTIFTIAPANIPFAGVPGLNPIVPLQGAYFHNETIVNSGLTAIASVDAYGNLTITFDAPIPAGVELIPQIDLYVASGAVVATTTTWDDTTPTNSILSILLGVAIPTLNVAYNPVGSAFGGATIQFETSIDGGVTWLPIFGSISTAGGVASSSLVLTGVASIVQFNVAGFTNFRIRLSTPITGLGVAEFGLLGSKLATNVTISGGWVTGTLTNDFAPPSNTNFGVLPALATAVPPANTEGNQVLLSTDLDGNLRVVVSGESDGTALRFAATTGQTLVKNSTAALVPILSIRPKVGATGVTFTFRNLDFLSNGSVSHFQLLLNATLTGASFVNVDSASSAQFDVSATAYTGGRLLDAGFVSTADRHNSYEFHFGFTLATPDTITIVFSAVGGNATSTAGSSFAWDEQT